MTSWQYRLAHGCMLFEMKNLFKVPIQTHTTDLKTVVIMLSKAVLIQLIDKSSYVFAGPVCNRSRELTCNIIYPMGEENMAASSAKYGVKQKEIVLGLRFAPRLARRQIFCSPFGSWLYFLFSPSIALQQLLMPLHLNRLPF